MTLHTKSQLKLQNIEIYLNEQPLVNLSTTVKGGEILTIMGPSGSGKSTLLAYVGGFLETAFKATGKIILNGQDITSLPAQNRKLGLLFQDPLLFPHMSIGGNLLFALPSHIKGMSARKQIACEALAQAGLENFFDRDPATLSGGQKSRVALIRILLAKPNALLLDEPFSKLDTDRKARVRRYVFDQATRLELPVLLVTHDEADAKAAAGPVIKL